MHSCAHAHPSNSSSASGGADDGAALDMDRPISEPKLLEELHSLRAKWREFGTALKMEQSDLDAIEKNAGGAVDRALQLMLTQWLKSDEERTWSQIVDALESQVVSERKLAKEIRDKHCRSYALDSKKDRGSEGMSDQVWRK